MARRSPGVKGSAVFAGTAALYLVYVGVKDVPFFSGLRELFRKQTPTPRAPKASSALGFAGTSQGTGRIVYAPGTTIRVDSSIAVNVGNLVRDAHADGFTGLSGSGYRTALEQAALRIKNGCPADMSAPADECDTPTAPVGQSMHEKGLAIDFTNGLSKITSGSAVFKWLQANAGKYGLYNLPGEPWHWSTNGH